MCTGKPLENHFSPSQSLPRNLTRIPLWQRQSWAWPLLKTRENVVSIAQLDAKRIGVVFEIALNKRIEPWVGMWDKNADP